MKYLILFIILIPCILPAQTIEVSAGSYIRIKTPIFVTLSKPLSNTRFYQVVNPRTHQLTLAQLIDSTTLVFILPDSMPAGTTQSYQIQGASKKANPLVTIKRQAEGILVQINNKPLFLYHTEVAMPPADSPSYYKKSGFIHPLYSPGGAVLTDYFPEGHAHQHAIFTAWANTTFRNQPIDFWNQFNQTGTVEHVQVLDTISGPVMAEMKILLRYKSFSQGEVLQEKWTIRVYPFSNYYLFDL